MSGSKKLTDFGVSEVFGIMLLLTITLVAAGVVSAYASGIGVKTGESNPRAKLRQKDVMDLRQRRFLYGTTYDELAKEYGVHKGTVMNAVKGKHWKCVQYFPEAPKEADHADS